MTLPMPPAMSAEASLDKSPHEDIAEFGIFRDERAQGTGANFKKFSRLRHTSARHRAGPGDQDHVSGKTARTMSRKYVLAREPGDYNIELSGKQNKQRQTIPSFEQDLSSPNCSHRAVRPDAVDLAGG